MYAKPAVLSLLLLMPPAYASAASLPTVDSAKSEAAAGGSIGGTITDTAGAVLKGAQILLQPSGTSVASKDLGDFSLSDIKPGSYTVTVTYIGFKTFTSSIIVTAGQNTLVNAVLAIGTNSQQVVVSANLEGDAAAINEQRTSANILNVETDTQIQSLPNANIADALGRLPGVTLQRNEGEGQYVQIRGTEPRLSNTTIDGVIVPGPDPEVRQVDLDTIPADLVGSIAINKTLSADQDGDAIGGSVDLRIKQATGDQPTLSFEGIGGNTPIAGQRQMFLINASAGMRFGKNSSFGKRFGAMAGYSYDLNDRAIDDVEPTPDLNPDGSTTFDGANIQEYLYNRTRYGFAGALDYKLAANSDLYAHGLFSNFRDYGQKYAYKLNGSNAKYSTSVRRPNLQVADIALGGNQVLSRSYLKYQVAMAHSRFGGAAGNPGADFKPVGGSNLDNLGTCSYSAAATISRYRPQFTGCTTPGASIYDPAQYALQDINTTTGQATQLNLQASGAMGINYHLGGHASIFEFGAQFRNEHKGQDAYSPTYDNGATPLMSQFLSGFTNPKFYGGSYHLGPVTSFDTIMAYLNANPGALALDEAATHQGSDAANYNLQERVSAGYLMNTLELGSRIHLQTGLRFEGTQTSTTGYLVTTNADGSYGGTTPQTGGTSYVDPLPSVQVRYTLDNNSDIRAVYGRGISRPDPYQLVPYVVFTVQGGPSGDNLVQVGNTSLVAEHANDYDLLYEKYLPSVGMIEAGYFYKQITKPIFLEQQLVPATGSPLSQVYGGAYSQQEVNGDHAWVQGFEVAYQQHMTYLPGVLAGTRLNANFAYTDSKNYNLSGRSDTPQLVGQAPFSWNVGPAFATKKALVTVGVTHNSANIYAYQYQSTGLSAVAYGVKGPNGDNYFYSHTQVDAQATYSLAKGFSVLASGANMNNEVFGFYNGSPQYMVQREYYKPTYSFGLKWTPRRE